ncbi:unnamed protein product, partial [Medioppia subpectinata]
FKVTLSALDVIETLVERLKGALTINLDVLVAILAKRLGDSRTVIRDSVIRVLHAAMMHAFPPQQLLDLLLLHKPSKNPKVREEVVNRVTAAVLTFPRSEFNLAKLCFSVAPLLTDSRRCVRLASLECLAVLAQALGPNRLASLMAAVEAIEQNVAIDGLVNALHARLARRQLPRCGADGTVRYVLNPQHFSGWFTSGADADLEWVMLATPSSTGGTPPKRANGSSGIPLAAIPFDRRKSNALNAELESEATDDDAAIVEAIGRRKSLAEVNIEQLLSSGVESSANERAFVDFRGESFQSDENCEHLESANETESLEQWREYFSEFRAQLAEVAIFGRNEKKRRNSELPVQPLFAQEVDGFRAESPVQSSSAPSTASNDAPFFAPDVTTLIEVEGMLAVTRLATFHAPALLKDQHALIAAIVAEVRNLRSTVARAAIFALGELFARLGAQAEPEMDAMLAALLAKSQETAVFIREDVERAILQAVVHLPQTRTAIALINGGANHRNASVRRTCAQFVSQLVERMGAQKCLLGPRDIADHVLPAGARFVQDSSPHTRYFGRKMFAVLMAHVSFEKLLRKHVTPGTYRNIVGILESVKRRGIGDKPQDLSEKEFQ